jgi:hypothetical protein
MEIPRPDSGLSKLRIFIFIAAVQSFRVKKFRTFETLQVIPTPPGADARQTGIDKTKTGELTEKN